MIRNFLNACVVFSRKRGARTLFVLAVTLLFLSPLPALAADPAVIQTGMTVRFDSFASGLGGTTYGSPLDIVPIPDGSGRMAIATFRGDIRLTDSSGNYLDTQLSPFLQTGTEWVPDLYGLTGIAFHPDYGNSGTRGYGKFYSVVSEDINNPGGSEDFNGLVPDSTFAPHFEVLAEFTASNPTKNAPTFTRRDVIRFRQPSGIHNLADLTFDSQGHLFLPFGDSQVTGNAQSKGDFLGTMFRIDPLDPSGFSDSELGTMGLVRSDNGKYASPTTNPTFGVPAELNEIFAYGLRSPFRVNVDLGAPDGTGRDDIYIGDVGAGSREEIDRMVSNGNYGWSTREGRLGTQPVGGSIDPLFELGHSTALNENGLISGGFTIIGGFVYRGDALPELQGKYVFGEMGRAVSGGQLGNKARMFYGDLDTGEIFQFLLDLDGETFAGKVLLSIGQDEQGELYAVLGDDPGFPIGGSPDGVVLKLVPEPSAGILLLIGLFSVSMRSRKWRCH